MISRILGRTIFTPSFFDNIYCVEVLYNTAIFIVLNKLFLSALKNNIMIEVILADVMFCLRNKPRYQGFAIPVRNEANLFSICTGFKFCLLSVCIVTYGWKRDIIIKLSISMRAKSCCGISMAYLLF